MSKSTDCFVCVDVETAGPNPGSYSLLSIGAASVVEPRRDFYVELQPINMAETEEAARIHKLSLAALAKSGLPPKEAMSRFAAWLKEISPDEQPVFVAFNAPFDWMFVNDYFQRYLGHNPFGHRALDMKALFMGLHHIAWEDTTYQFISAHYGLPEALSHHASQDAQQGAELFAAMLEEMKEKNLER